MALNKKMQTYISEEVAAGRMTKEYGDKLGGTLGEATDQFQTGWLRQSDYDRQMADANSVKQKWETWGVDATKELQKYHDRNVELEAAMAAGGLTPGQSTDVAKELVALKEQMSKIATGFVTKSDFDAQLAAAKNDVRVSTIGIMGDFDSERRKVEHEHFVTFGKVMTPAESDAVIEFANNKAKELGRQVTITDAYNMKYADETRKKWEVDTEARITKDVQTRLGVPVQGGPPSLDRGPLQVRMEQLEGKDLPLGSDGLREAKAKAAAALRAAGSF